MFGKWEISGFVGGVNIHSPFPLDCSEYLTSNVVFRMQVGSGCSVLGNKITLSGRDECVSGSVRWSGDGVVVTADRYGVMPFYYLVKSGVTYFSNDISILVSIMGSEVAVDFQGLVQYLTFQNIFDDHTLFKEIREVPPGYKLHIGVDGSVKSEQWWDFIFNPNESLPFWEAKEMLRNALLHAVSDAAGLLHKPCCFLSGGIDTSLLANMLTDTCSPTNKPCTFTCGFDGGTDERRYAEFVAQLIESYHYEVVLHSADLDRGLEKLTTILGYPRMGQSYPDYFVTELVSKFSSKVISGCVADELFAGYPWRYRAALGVKTYEDFRKRAYSMWQRIIDVDSFSLALTPEVHSEVGEVDVEGIFSDVLGRYKPLGKYSYIDNLLYFELKTFTRGLLAVDGKIAMNLGVELSLPFLDSLVVDLAMQVPAQYKIDFRRGKRVVDENDVRRYHNNSGGKQILRSLASEYLPASIVKRPKQGFSGPDADWFRLPSGNMVLGLLHSHDRPIYSLIKHGFIDKVVNEHLSGEKNHRLLIWSFLSLDSWLSHFGVDTSTSKGGYI